MTETTTPPDLSKTDWRNIIAKYATADVRESLWQVSITLFFLIA